MENVCKTGGKNSTTTEFPATETSCSIIHSISTAGGIHTFYKPFILTAPHFLRRVLTFNGMSPFNRCTKTSLLSFLGDVLNWLTGTATTKEVRSIKNCGQHTNCNATPTTRNISTHYFHFESHQICHSGEQTTNQPGNGHRKKDITMLYNITNSLFISLDYQQIVPYICSILANIRDSLYYMRQVVIHAMDNINAATTGILSPSSRCNPSRRCPEKC